MGRPDFFHANSRIAVVAATGGPVTSLSDGFDEDPNPVAWIGDRIWFQALQKTTGHLFSLDVTSKAITRASTPDSLIGSGFSLSKDASRVAFTAGSPTSMTEVFSAESASPVPQS